MSVDSYRRDYERKLDEIAKLQAEKSRLVGKMSTEQKKESDARKAMQRTKSSSVLASKQKTVMTSQSAQARIQKDIANVDAKLSRATKAADSAKAKVEKEESRALKRPAKAYDPIGTLPSYPFPDSIVPRSDHFEGEPPSQRGGLPRIFETAVGRYTRIKGGMLGEGGVGRVFRVEDDGGRIYALKAIKPDAARNSDKLKRFQREIRFCESESSAHIARVIDDGFYTDERGLKVPFSVMPVYDCNLRQLVQAGEKGTGEILALLVDMIDGLHGFYASGNFHRDVKPQNILYDSRSERLVLADLGAAHLDVEIDGLTVETTDGQRLANFDYAAPEQHGDRRTADVSTDIYAYGLVLNELFTGKIPQGTMYTRVADVNPEYAFLDEVVEHMIAQDPDDRYASTHAVVEDINARWAESDKAREAMRARQRAIEENGYSVSIVGKQWDSYNLEVRLNSIVDEDWQGCFKGYGEYVQGVDNQTWGARDCEFDGDTIFVYSIGTDKDLIHRVYDNIKAAVAWANDVATKELRLRESEDARAEYAADSARENYLENYAELNSFLSELD